MLYISTGGIRHTLKHLSLYCRNMYEHVRPVLTVVLWSSWKRKGWS